MKKSSERRVEMATRSFELFNGGRFERNGLVAMRYGYLYVIVVEIRRDGVLILSYPTPNLVSEQISPI